MYICMCVYVYVYIFSMYVYARIIYVYIYACMDICMSVFMYASIYVFIYEYLINLRAFKCPLQNCMYTQHRQKLTGIHRIAAESLRLMILVDICCSDISQRYSLFYLSFHLCSVFFRHGYQ